MNKEIKKELNIIAILILLLTISSVITSIMFSKEIIEIKDTTNEAIVCVPIIKEDYYGDVYTLHCVKESVFKEAVKEKDAIERVL